MNTLINRTVVRAAAVASLGLFAGTAAAQTSSWEFVEAVSGDVLATIEFAGSAPYDHTDLVSMDFTAAGAAALGVPAGPAQAPFTRTANGSIGVNGQGQLDNNPTNTLVFMDTPFQGYNFAGGGGSDAISLEFLIGGTNDSRIYISIDLNGPGSGSVTGEWWPILPCVGDADGNGTIDLSDLALVLSEFGMSGAELAGDVNGDGTVDLSDLADVLGNFGSGC